MVLKANAMVSSTTLDEFLSLKRKVTALTLRRGDVIDGSSFETIDDHLLFVDHGSHVEPQIAS